MVHACQFGCQSEDVGHWHFVDVSAVESWVTIIQCPFKLHCVFVVGTKTGNLQEIKLQRIFFGVHSCVHGKSFPKLSIVGWKELPEAHLLSMSMISCMCFSQWFISREKPVTDLYIDMHVHKHRCNCHGSKRRKKDIILNPETKRSATGQQNESVICGILHVRGSPAGRSQKRIYTDLQHQLPAAFAMIELDHLILPPPLATVFERDLTTTTLAPPWPFPAQLPRNPCGTSALSGQLGTGKAGLFWD